MKGIEKLKAEVRFAAGLSREDITLRGMLTDTVDEVVEFFEGDVDKASLWFNTNNHLLGGASPMGMIRLGRFEKLLSFITVSLDENKR